VNRIEIGSDFDLSELSGLISNSDNELKGQFGLSSSGRAALFILLEMIVDWKRVWIPAYYCEDVSISLQLKYNDRVFFYEDSPLVKDDSIFVELFEPADVVIRINYFGLRYPSNWHKKGVYQIYDLTHAMHEFISLPNDSMAFASLRKTLPIPDGGISNQRFYLGVSTDHETICWKRAFAMSLKATYLKGGNLDKVYWRNLFIETEKCVGNACSDLSEVSKNILSRVDLKEVLLKKRANLNYLIGQLSKTYIYGDVTKYSNAFSLVLNFENNRERESVRLELIKRNIYPAVYWPFSESFKKQHSSQTLTFSDTSLSLPADFRYSEKELDHVLSVLNEVL
jgi:hypothetical protein